MAAAVIMPKMGLTMEKATVVRWLVKEGQRVRKGEALLEVETDKIVTEVASPAEGTVRRILAAEGSEVPVKACLAWIGEAEQR